MSQNQKNLVDWEERIAALRGASDLEKAVWLAIAKIPLGQVRDYSEIAVLAGFPRAVRAVASAVGRNPFPVDLPCHRVIRKNGQLGQYTGGGPVRKRQLLLAEGVIFSSENLVHRN